MNRLFVLVAFTLTSAVYGDEPKTYIHFRDKVQVNSRVVLLSDVADIDSSDERMTTKLRQTELIAAPAAGQVRSLRQRELIDHIQLNGFNLQQIEFSGASMTQVSVGNSAKGVKATAPTAGRLAAAQRRVKQVVLSYLRAANPDARRAAMEVTCDQACATAASTMSSTISVVAAEPVGASEYDVIVAINSKGQVEEFTVKATVAETSRVVVATRALRAGTILTAADLKLASPKSDAEMSLAVGEVEELIGHELIRAVGPDQIIPIDQIVQPRLIRKGDLVDVTAKSGGVRVTTQAVAQEDGSLDQSISLEPVDSKAKVAQKNKETIRAQVVASGQAQIEIAGRTPSANRIGAEPVRLRPSTGRISTR